MKSPRFVRFAGCVAGVEVGHQPQSNSRQFTPLARASKTTASLLSPVGSRQQTEGPARYTGADAGPAMAAPGSQSTAFQSAKAVRRDRCQLSTILPSMAIIGEKQRPFIC